MRGSLYRKQTCTVTVTARTIIVDRTSSSSYLSDSQILAENRVLLTPPVYDASVRGRVPVGILPSRLVRKKTRMVCLWLPDGKKS